MQESTPHSSSWSKSALGLSHITVLVKVGQYQELVLPSLPPPVRRIREERAELVCGTDGALTSRQNRPTQAVLSEGGKEQRGKRDRAWQQDLPFRVEESVSFEPHLAVDSEVEPRKEGIQDTGQT